MAYDTANTYETIELFGLTEKDTQLPIPEDHILTDRVIRESFEALLGPLRGTGLEAEIEPLAHRLATILQRRKVALGKEVDRTADWTCHAFVPLRLLTYRRISSRFEKLDVIYKALLNFPLIVDMIEC